MSEKKNVKDARTRIKREQERAEVRTKERDYLYENLIKLNELTLFINEHRNLPFETILKELVSEYFGV